ARTSWGSSTRSRRPQGRCSTAWSAASPAPIPPTASPSAKEPSMPDRSDRLLEQVAALAADLGPALAPVGQLELLRSITAAARELFDPAACSLALLDEAQETLIFHVASGADSEEVVGQRVPVNRGIAGWVVSSGQPVAVADVAADPRFAAAVAEATGDLPRSGLA